MTPEVFPSLRTVGPVPFSKYSGPHEVQDLPVLVGEGVGTPQSSASSVAISSVHWLASTKKPSSLSSTLCRRYLWWAS